ncbi:MAG: SDR family oxidoreductase [Dehalococcoidia bacterium]|nr:SDR family oxidoreductase [Dehalococcoidia bacterium]
MPKAPYLSGVARRFPPHQQRRRHTTTLQGKVALVTGAGRGIGQAIALELARQGAAVGLAAKTASEVEAVAREIQAAGGRALAVSIDVGDPAQVDHLVRTVEAGLGPIAILVNNAGIRGPVGFVQNVPPQEWQDVFRVNIFGAFLTIRAVLPEMIGRRWGRIINMSGGGAMTGMRGGAAYGASKSAVVGLTLTVAQEAQRFGITCNAIQPGRVITRSFPALGRPGEGDGVPPEHAARCAAWLCTEEASGTTGQTLNAVEWDQKRGQEQGV